MVFQNSISRVYGVLTHRIHFQSLWSSCNCIPRVAGAPRISFPEFMALLEFSFQRLFMAFVESPFHGFQPSYNHFWTLSHSCLLQKYSTNTHTKSQPPSSPLVTCTTSFIFPLSENPFGQQDVAGTSATMIKLEFLCWIFNVSWWSVCVCVCVCVLWSVCVCVLWSECVCECTHILACVPVSILIIKCKFTQHSVSPNNDHCDNNANVWLFQSMTWCYRNLNLLFIYCLLL